MTSSAFRAVLFDWRGTRRIVASDFDKWVINEMEPNTRLRRYLARARAWPEPDRSAALMQLGEMRFF